MRWSREIPGLHQAFLHLRRMKLRKKSSVTPVIFCRKRRKRKAEAGSQTLFIHLLNFFFDFGAFFGCKVSRSTFLDGWSAVRPEENFAQR
jgi:hypothetical protein